MADVMKIAMARRDEVRREIGKYDEFIRMAESLIRSPQPGRAGDKPLVLGSGEESGLRLASQSGE